MFKITTQELSTLAADILQIFVSEEDFIRTIIEEFVYVGFDVLAFVAALKGCEADSQKFKNDLVSMIILFLSRGNSVTNMKKKMGQAGRSKLDNLISTYAIKPRVGDNSNPNVVTLARVATSFTYVTAKILDSTSLTLPYNIQLEFDSCPKSLSLSSIFSLLPLPFQVYNKGELENLIGACLYCQYKQYTVINGKNKQKLTDPVEIGNHIITYAVISYRSNVYTNEQRLEHSINLKYFENEPKPSLILACVKDMMSILCSLFSPDIESNFF